MSDTEMVRAMIPAGRGSFRLKREQLTPNPSPESILHASGGLGIFSILQSKTYW
jgi:hypothetical protein